MLLPGEQRREHLWASRNVRDDMAGVGITDWQRGAWERLRARAAEWPGTVLISHEFFAAASAEQARDAIEALAPAEVHLVATAREPLGLFTSSWQESLKNRETAPMGEYSRTVSEDPTQVWNWRTLDLGLVLDRWAPAGGPVRPEHVHVLPLPGRDHPREEIWRRFAGLLGLDADAYDLSGSFPNEAMGVAEAETLRRVNAHLDAFVSAIDKGTYIRSFLADERLVPRAGDRFWPADDQVEDARRRARAAVALVRERGYDVVGELADLLVPDELPERRHPESVTDGEVAAVATELVATMLGDVRALRHERRRLRVESREAAETVSVLQARVDDLEGRVRAPLWRVAGSRAKQLLRGGRPPT
ncbi:hypothetical protein GCM10011519_12380 [Marmoricola endophyticus]|uniref:Sulfotransferase family protein n=1 Tax=Marmoricola endophyticus TaxID=2040280 RepID=A0A917BGN6_9ACTN|nr:hypothetical protein GCM10011519_12380 [Marmoricola endophyticus]